MKKWWKEWVERWFTGHNANFMSGTKKDDK